MKTFTISAHKFYSPDFRLWLWEWWLKKVLVSGIHARQFGEVEITVGYENSDPDDVRSCLNAIGWRTKNDFYISAHGYNVPELKFNSSKDYA